MIRREMSPAVLGSIALHGAVAAALLISWPWARTLKVGSVVPVTIVSSAPAGDPPPAVEDTTEQMAMTEAPAPEAPAEVQPPPPPPPPPPPKAAPTPTPTPAPKPVEKPAPKKPEKRLDLAALEASVSKLVPRAQPKASAAEKGPARAATSPQARQTTGTDPAAMAAAMSGLAEELQRRWNPNCEVEGGQNVQVRVVFALTPSGQVLGDPTWRILRGPQTSVGQAAGERAVRAVYAAAPYRNLPREFYGDPIAVNFNAREACSS